MPSLHPARKAPPTSEGSRRPKYPRVRIRRYGGRVLMLTARLPEQKQAGKILGRRHGPAAPCADAAKPAGYYTPKHNRSSPPLRTAENRSALRQSGQPPTYSGISAWQPAAGFPHPRNTDKPFQTIDAAIEVPYSSLVAVGAVCRGAIGGSRGRRRPDAPRMGNAGPVAGACAPTAP